MRFSNILNTRVFFTKLHNILLSKKPVDARKVFIKWVRGVLYNDLVDMDALKNIVSTILNECNKKISIPITNVIEKYSVSEYLNVYIVEREGLLYYVVQEPEAPLNDLTEVITLLFRYGYHCSTVKCLIEVIERVSPKYLDALAKNAETIFYYYNKLKTGYGPLYPLILDENIEEISGSEKAGHLYVIHRRYPWYGWIQTNIAISPSILEMTVLALARKARRHLSLSQPIAEGLTPEGLRVALTFSTEVSRHGTSFVVRKKPTHPWTITMAIDRGVLSPLLASYLWLVLELRGSILIVGGIGTGKTTLLQSLLTLIPPSRRVVTIEDTPEITTTTGLWDPLTVRYSIHATTSIDEYKLLRFALRRRADYIVVGEVRGREARLLIQASRLGHGTIATFHADDPFSAIERLTAPPISIPRPMLSSIWTIVSMDPMGSNTGARKVKSVYEISHDAKRLIPIFIYNQAGNTLAPNTALDIISRSIRLKALIDEETLQRELETRTLFLSSLANNGVFEVSGLSTEIQKFYSVEEDVAEKAIGKEIFRE